MDQRDMTFLELRQLLTEQLRSSISSALTVHVITRNTVWWMLRGVAINLIKWRDEIPSLRSGELSSLSPFS